MTQEHTATPPTSPVGALDKTGQRFQELTLADAITFIIRLRSFIIAGIVAGTILGGTVAYLYGISGYYTEVYLRADYSAHPAIEKPEKVAKIMGNILRSTWGVGIVFDTLEERSTVFSRERNAVNLEKDTFVLKVMALEPYHRIVFKELSAKDEYVMQVSLPVRSFEDEAGRIIGDAVNQMIARYNEAANSNQVLKRETSIRSAKQRYAHAEQIYSESVLNVFEQLQESRQELIRIDYLLTSKIPESLRKAYGTFLGPEKRAATSQVIVPMSTGKNQQSSSVGNIRKNIDELLRQDMDRLVKMSVLIKNKNLAPAEEIDALINRAYAVQKAVAALDSGKTIAEAKMALKTSATNLTRIGDLHAAELDPSTFNLPKFEVDTTLYASESSNVPFELKSSNRRKVFLMVLLIAVVAFTFVGFMRILIKRSRESMISEES